MKKMKMSELKKNTLQYLLIIITTLSADVTLPTIFGSHMVLQRNQTIKIWGQATNGESVQVQINGQTKVTTATQGKWSIYLDAMNAGGPYELKVQGNNQITLTDVMIGEVWHAAGQSNMDTRMNYWEYPNLSDSIKTANYPHLRYITMRQPGQTIQWQNVTPSTVGSMSATAYFMGKELLSNLQPTFPKSITR
jgi:sialate O-acetylesterase